MRRLFAAIAAAVLSTLSVNAASWADDKAVLAPITVAQRQQARWMAAFLAWRRSTTAWAEETPREAAVRKDTRLLIMPTPTPVLSAQRRLDGFAVVISSGMIALLDELLLAEGVSDVSSASAPEGPDCFTSYAAQVHEVARRYQPPTDYEEKATPIRAWPRLTQLVDGGRAPAGCASLTPSKLRSAAMQAKVDENADALALWVLSRQTACMAALPPKEAAPAPAKKPPPPAEEQKARTACRTEAASSAGASLSAADDRARLALCRTDRLETRTVPWLRQNANLFGKARGCAD